MEVFKKWAAGEDPKTAEQMAKTLDDRILFFHDEEKRHVSINVPRNRATEEFKKEVRTAAFIEFSLDAPSAIGAGNQVRVTLTTDRPLLLPWVFLLRIFAFPQRSRGLCACISQHGMP
jgi:hypothetical protein